MNGEGNYKEGMREGLWEFFWPNGNIMASRNYHKDEWDGMYIDCSQKIKGQIVDTGCYIKGKEATA